MRERKRNLLLVKRVKRDRQEMDADETVRERETSIIPSLSI